jgi:hypothetical protein
MCTSNVTLLPRARPSSWLLPITTFSDSPWLPTSCTYAGVPVPAPRTLPVMTLTWYVSMSLCTCRAATPYAAACSRLVPVDSPVISLTAVHSCWCCCVPQLPAAPPAEVVGGQDATSCSGSAAGPAPDRANERPMSLVSMRRAMAQGSAGSMARRGERGVAGVLAAAVLRVRVRAVPPVCGACLR